MGKKKVVMFLNICFLILVLSFPIYAFEEMQITQKQQYPDLSYFKDYKNYPIKLSEIFSKMQEIYSNVVEPEDNDKGYVEYPQGLINRLMDNPKMYLLI